MLALDDGSRDNWLVLVTVSMVAMFLDVWCSVCKQVCGGQQLDWR